MTSGNEARTARDDLRAIVVFDLDKTLTKRDTYLPFLAAFLAKHPRRIVRCFLIPLTVLRLAPSYQWRTSLKVAFLDAVLGQCERNELLRVTEAFVTRLVSDDGLIQDGLDQLEFHRQRGDVLVLASASLDLYVDELARRLGFDSVIATRARWHDDRVAGTLEGPNLKGPEKYAAVLRHFPAQDLQSRGIAYSDHLSDLPLLGGVKEPFLVNPSKAASVAAKKLGINIVHWR
jgi:phosphatidylglycerophosphatase C